LLERLYDRTAGEILFSGINIKNFNLTALRRNIGYVQQEPVLFNQSIRENFNFRQKGNY
jgi:ABC-type multidrug transport system fused ATPase/permease subunit